MKSGYLGQEIPKLGFGLMRLPMAGGEIDIDQTKRMVDRFIERGFTYFDTAYPYIGGKSEVAAGEALVKRYPRASFQLASKMPVWMVKEYDDMPKLFQTQLDRTGAGYFDFYLLHALGADRLESLENTGAWDFIRRYKEQGLIRHMGFSFHDEVSVLDRILTDHPEAEFVQLQLNYADWENDKIQSRLCYETAMKHGKPVIVMEPVKGGSLAAMGPDIQATLRRADPDASTASWALRFAASLDGIITVLSGMSSIGQMEDNLETMSGFRPLSTSEREALAQVVEALQKVETVPCTACRYCVESCPSKINIPAIFEGYNDYKVYQNLESSKGHYRWVTSNGGKASACIECGACEEHCPQHIEIPKLMKEIAGVLE